MKGRKREGLLAGLLLLAGTLPAQETVKEWRDGSYYRWPTAGDISLSANYGEVRANHFHSGLDIRVGGAPGAPVLAVADGYVSRISVKPSGYGKAVYITHANGTTSVYGHLDTFSPPIAAYIEQIQYARRRFAVEAFPDTAALTVRQGEAIGAAGNSGSSTGPHLHFEIRDTQTQTPLDVFSHGYYPPPDDRLPPVFRTVLFFSYTETDGVPCIAPFSRQTVRKELIAPVVEVPDTFFIAMDVLDVQPGTPATFGVHRLEVTLDGAPVFACRLTAIPFDLSLYVNSAIAYDEYCRNKRSLLKTYIEPGNRLPVYYNVANRGLLSLPDTLPHRLTATATDDAGNRSSATFIVLRRAAACRAAPDCRTEAGTPVTPQSSATLVYDGLQVVVPAGALYRPARISVDSLPARPKQAWSAAWRVHTPETPLHRAIAVSLAAPLPPSVQSKALVASLSDAGAVVSVGGGWRNGRVETTTRAFGRFFAAVDVTPPRITPLFARGAKCGRQASLKIKITDDLSGIASYSASIDGQWALFEYDAKNDRLVYRFDSRRIRRNRLHRLQITVTDHKQNTATLQTSFYW